RQAARRSNRYRPVSSTVPQCRPLRPGSLALLRGDIGSIAEQLAEDVGTKPALILYGPLAQL
ncbi:MAG: hypothetical protein AAFV87_11795, partial [Pseudomonadota bacterium]